MANIIDYIDWRGDLTFLQSKFNDVDNLIFTELAYIPFEEVLQNHVESITIREAARRFHQMYPKEAPELGVFLPQYFFPLLYKMGDSRRFEDVIISRYSNRLDLANEKQFAALTYELPDGTCYVAYRGTDDTIVGWKENFNISFMDRVPAQQEAVEYLEKTAECYPGAIRVGGHSKGGNLAVYGMVYAAEEVQKRVLKVYNNDGPGFLKKVVDSEEYQKVCGKITSIVPELSIVGMLMEHGEGYYVVKSSQTGLYQHDGFSWEVLGTGFVEVPQTKKESRQFDAALKKILSEMGEPEREQFVDTVFQVLESSGAHTLTDLVKEKTYHTGKIMKNLASLEEKDRRLVFDFFGSLFRETLAEGQSDFYKNATENFSRLVEASGILGKSRKLPVRGAKLKKNKRIGRKEDESVE